MDKPENLPHGTRVVVNTTKNDDGTFEQIEGVIVGLGSAHVDPVLGALHLVRCTDGYLPNKIYPYDTFVAPLGIIDIIV